MKPSSWGLSNSPDLKTDGPFKEDDGLRECEWCAEIVSEEDLKEVPDYGFKHAFDEKGNLIRIGCAIPMKSRVCQKCAKGEL